MPYDENGKYYKYDYVKKGTGPYTVETAGGRRRMLRKVFDLADGNITVLFPKFVTELKAVSDHYKLDSVTELLSALQGMCLAEGLKPVWKKWTPKEERERIVLKGQRERAARLVDARARRREEREKLAADFPDRVKAVRKRLGDY